MAEALIIGLYVRNRPTEPLVPAILGRWDNGDMYLTRKSRFQNIVEKNTRRIKRGDFAGYVVSQRIDCGEVKVLCPLDAMLPIERAWPGVWQKTGVSPGGLADWVHSTIKTLPVFLAGTAK